MKIAKKQLGQIIKEELEAVMNEAKLSEDIEDSEEMSPGVFTVYGNPMHGRLEAIFPGTTRFIKATFRQWNMTPRYVHGVLGNPANNGKKIKDVDPRLAPHLASQMKDEDLKDPAVFAEFTLRIPRYSWKNIEPYGR